MFTFRTSRSKVCPVVSLQASDAVTRRSPPRKRTDDLAFPVHVRFAVPRYGLGQRMNALHDWLTDRVGPGGYAVHGSTALAQDAMAVYLRTAEEAQAMVAAFPDLQLADGTMSTAYVPAALPQDWSAPEVFGVCNLYAMTAAQAAIREIAGAMEDRTGNLPALPAIFPDQAAPVVANVEGARVLTRMRWGLPSPAFALKGKKTDRGVTNVRNTGSSHWRRWLGHEHRCVVPFTSFSEPDNRPGRPSEPVWFALSEDRPLAVFAGLWTRWTSVRKLKDGETADELFAFLTTGANAEVGAVHPRAMPVILRTPGEIDTWMDGATPDALALQRPLPDGALQVVARGTKADGAAE